MSVLKKKKIRKNRKKVPAKTKKRRSLSFNINWAPFCTCFGSIICFAVLSFSLIFSYAWLIQCDVFGAEKIRVSGLGRLTKKDVLEQAGVERGKNIFKINLNVTRQSLLAHPWIKKAEVIREMPDCITIRIIEHIPLAVVGFDKKYLMNRDGEIFKRYHKEPKVLPLISGLYPEDINIAGKYTMKIETEPHKAVMNIIKIARDPNSVIAYNDIKQILVDRELGLTLVTGTGVEKIKLGYDRYSDKIKRFDEVSQILKEKASQTRIDTIDLNDINRIVVKPTRQEA